MPPFFVFIMLGGDIMQKEKFKVNYFMFFEELLTQCKYILQRKKLYTRDYVFLAISYSHLCQFCDLEPNNIDYIKLKDKTDTIFTPFMIEFCNKFETDEQ